MERVFKLYVTPGGTKASTQTSEMSLWLPATPYELLDVWDRLGLSADAPVRFTIEGNLIGDIPGLSDADAVDRSGDDLYALNHLAQKLSELDDIDSMTFMGLLQIDALQRKEPPDILRLLDLACGVENCHVAFLARTDEQLGEFVVEYGLDPDLEELPDEALDWLHNKGLLNYQKIGEKHRLAANGVFVRSPGQKYCGYVEPDMEVPEVSKQLDLHMKEPDYTVLLQMSDGREVKLPARAPLPEGSFTCLDCKIPSIRDMIGHEWNLKAVDRFAQLLDTLTLKELSVCKAVIEATACTNLDQVKDVIRQVEEYILSPNQRTPADYAKEMLSVILSRRDVEELTPFVNLHRYGEALMQRLHCTATEYGIVERNDGQPLMRFSEEQNEMTGMEGMV